MKQNMNVVPYFIYIICMNFFTKMFETYIIALLAAWDKLYFYLLIQGSVLHCQKCIFGNKLSLCQVNNMSIPLCVWRIWLLSGTRVCRWIMWSVVSGWPLASTTSSSFIILSLYSVIERDARHWFGRGDKWFYSPRAMVWAALKQFTF